MDFESLVDHIHHVQNALQAQAAHAVNLSLTVRNWLVGFYIVEFEQHGEDRAKYGDNLLKRLAKSLNRRGFGERRLYEYRQVYQIYPQLYEVVIAYAVQNGQDEILRLSSAKISRYGFKCREIAVVVRNFVKTFRIMAYYSRDALSKVISFALGISV